MHFGVQLGIWVSVDTKVQSAFFAMIELRCHWKHKRRMGEDQPGLHLHRWRRPILHESEALGVLESRGDKFSKVSEQHCPPL